MRKICSSTLQEETNYPLLLVHYLISPLVYNNHSHNNKIMIKNCISLPDYYHNLLLLKSTDILTQDTHHGRFPCSFHILWDRCTPLIVRHKQSGTSRGIYLRAILFLKLMVQLKRKKKIKITICSKPLMKTSSRFCFKCLIFCNQ